MVWRRCGLWSGSFLVRRRRIGFRVCSNRVRWVGIDRDLQSIVVVFGVGLGGFLGIAPLRRLLERENGGSETSRVGVDRLDRSRYRIPASIAGDQILFVWV
ncbi:hypothetical protein RchiOBHm_Chr4g0399811 [Rosa chinensis]|uniref:Uncharacterized protein n=1 Tax=Rosa chinensis TaxID=74649 RepID=A0A2P6QSM9_ROSCH|nr:hypothetical protein RchiOBHm_Chr4g0399811 [Rosa chinensis]